MPTSPSLDLGQVLFAQQGKRSKLNSGATRLASESITYHSYREVLRFYASSLYYVQFWSWEYKPQVSMRSFRNCAPEDYRLSCCSRNLARGKRNSQRVAFPATSTHFAIQAGSDCSAHLLNLWRVARLVRRERIELIHCNEP